MPDLFQLLSDSGASIELIVKGNYLDENGDLHTEWVSQTGWDDEINGEAGIYIPALLANNLRINQQVDPLELLSSFDAFGDIELSNNNLNYSGRYDPWWKYSIDDQDWTVYAVGILTDGTRIELSDVLNTPLFTLKGVNTPETSSDGCRIRTKDRHSLSTALQPITYSPPALLFPGTLAGIVDLGDNLDITGVQSLSVWVYLNDVNTTQYILLKDSGTAGYYLAVGLVVGGTIVGGVEIGVRGQTPFNTGTAANVLKPFRWHRIDISIDTTTRRIDVDGTTAITSAGITGTPLGNSLSLEVGRSLNGRLHRLIYWSNARSNTTMSAEGRVPITGAESNLREAFLMGEGKGSSIASSKTGSVLTGTLAAGVLWDTASWHYESILGQYEPYVLGTVPRVPVTWIDPPKQTGQVSKGAIALLSELQSNHAAVSAANYSINLSNGTVTVSTGALSGTYSATVTANNLWLSALYFDGIASRAWIDYTMPAGSKYLGCHFRCDNIKSTTRVVASWPVSSGFARLNLNIGGGNIPNGQTANDAGTVFTVTCPFAITIGTRYSILVSVDTANPATGLQLYLNGALVATAAISGAFTGTQPTLGVGHRASLVDLFFNGVIDELIVGNTACTLAMAQQFHSIPVTASFTGVAIGWHLNEATGTSAAPFVGVGNLTLTSTSWVSGRCAPADLARSILYSHGLTESELDFDSWHIALNKCAADCGWFVKGGISGIDLLNTVLGGLGFILYKVPGSAIKIKRFEGLTGTSTSVIDPELKAIARPIEPSAADPAIYLWTIIFATNNSKQDAANIAGSLATTDPDRYQYGSMPSRSVAKSDGSVLQRFPSAQTRSRVTALLNLVDAEAEGNRLLALHKHGADRKSLGAFLSVGGLETLEEIGPLMAETDLDDGNLIVTGISIEDSVGTISIWRPAI